MISGGIALCLAAASSLVLGCASRPPPRATSQGQLAPPVVPVAPAGPYVPGGTTFTVRLDRALDSSRSHVGDPFIATTTTELRATDGSTVVPAGAAVRGEVAEVGVTPARIVLRPRTIDTVRGAASISATVRATEGSRYVTREVIESPPVGDRGAIPFPTAAPSSPGEVGFEAFGYYGVVRGRAMYLPVGSELELQLAAPLVAPAAPLVAPD